MTVKLNPETFPTKEEEFYNRTTKEWDSRIATAPIFMKEGRIYCYSVEMNDFSRGAFLFSAYDCEFREPLWVCDELVAWAKEHVSPDAYWEWENPEMICLAV